MTCQFLLILGLACFAMASFPTADYYCNQKTKEIPPFQCEGCKLRQLQILIRHGDRTRCGGGPTCWDNDDVTYTCTNEFSERTFHTSNPSRLYRESYMEGRNVLKGNCMMGQLTEIGIEQHVGNGKMLADVYLNAQSDIPSSLNDEDFYLRSDDCPRTKMSGQALMWGMYPPTGEETVSWLTMDGFFETIVPNANVCPAYSSEVQKAHQSPAFLAHMKNVSDPLLETLRQKLGAGFLRDYNTYNAVDCFMSHYCHSLEMPSVVDEDMIKAVIEDTSWQQQYTYMHGNVRRFANGPLVGEIYDKFRQMVSGAPVEKFLLYSGHDFGPIMSTLAAFNVSDGMWPPYASLIAIELWEMADSKFKVRLVYNGKPLLIPGCDDVACDFALFESICKRIVPTAEECGAGQVSGPRFEDALFL